MEVLRRASPARAATASPPSLPCLGRAVLETQRVCLHNRTRRMSRVHNGVRLVRAAQQAGVPHHARLLRAAEVRIPIAQPKRQGGNAAAQ